MKHITGLTLACLSLLGLWASLTGCMNEPGPNHYVHLSLHDSLYTGDSVQIFMMAREGEKVIDTLFHGTLDDSGQVSRCPAPHYRSGDFSIHILYYRDDSLFRTALLLETRPGEKSKVVMKYADTLKPEIRLIGAETDTLFVGDTYADSGSVCTDNRGRPTSFRIPETLGTNAPHTDTLRYVCRDKTGNTDTAYRYLVIQARPLPPPPLDRSDTLYTLQDALFEMPTVNASDNGYTPIIGLAPTWYPQANAHDFDFKRIDPKTLKRARLQCLTWAWPKPWAEDSVTVTFRVRSIRSAWKEGTGNWYWHDGGYRNNGDIIMRNYGIPDSITRKSTNPSIKTGINAADSDLFADAKLDSVKVDSVRAFFPQHPATEMPLPAQLQLLTVDVTDFLKTADVDQCHGFFIQVDGMPRGYSVAVPTKEVNDGRIAPRLVLDY